MDNVQTVEQLFSGRLFVVPDYQRGYSWEILQLKEFIEDVELLPPGKEHYTGTVILHSQEASLRDAHGKGYAVVDIVDGQQRLITIVLLLNAIQRAAVETPQLSKLGAGIGSMYVQEEDQVGQPLFKLRLNRDSNSFWIDSVLSETPNPAGPRILSHRRLLDAKNYFQTYLQQKSAELAAEYPAWLRELHDKLTHRLRLSLYTVGDESDVGVVFEVTNDRGKPLTELEKVKNYLLYVAAKLDLEEHDLTVTVNDAWRNIFERLMAADLTSSTHEDQLLRAHWLMSRDHNKKNWSGTKSVKATFSLKRYQGRHVELLAAIKSYVKSLDDASVAYRDLEKPTHTDAFGAMKDDRKLRAAAVEWTEKLRRVGATATFLPFLIAARLKGDPAFYVEAVKLCEVFAFRVYKLLRTPAYAAQSRMFRLGNRLYSGSLSTTEALRQLQGYVGLYSQVSEFEDAFVLEEGRNWYTWPGLKYFLYEYEGELARGKPVQLPWAVLEKRDLENSIEHVLPQTPTEPYWTARFDTNELEILTHDLGNLGLTYDNSSYSNKPFPEKKGSAGSSKPCYANSNLFQERALCDFDDWTPDSVDERRQRIIDWAVKRWHVDPVSLDQSELEEEQELAESDESEEEETGAVDAPSVKPRRGWETWSVDRYIERGVPESAAHVAEELVRRIRLVMPSDWKVVFRKHRITVRRSNKKLAIAIGVSRRPQLRLAGSSALGRDPYPNLNGTRSPRGDWRWSIRSVDEIPDLSELVRLAQTDEVVSALMGRPDDDEEG